MMPHITVGISLFNRLVNFLFKKYSHCKRTSKSEILNTAQSTPQWLATSMPFSPVVLYTELHLSISSKETVLGCVSYGLMSTCIRSSIPTSHRYQYMDSSV